MNKSFISNSLMGVLLIAALSLSACSSNNSSDVRVVGRGNGVLPNGTPQQQGGVPATCPNAQMNMGKIFDPYASANFEMQVKNFVSATLDPQSLGTISGNIADKTGIDFEGSFQFDNMGNLVPASSNVMVKIFDSYVGQAYNGQTIQPYVVQFTAANSGIINRNTHQFEVRFRDSYGDIVFQGQYDNQLVQGTVSYVNNTAVDGYSPSSGTLGAFKAYTCSLIK